MQSIVNRLSDEEMKELFETSVDHFKAVIGLKREFVKELKETAQHDKVKTICLTYKRFDRSLDMSTRYTNNKHFNNIQKCLCYPIR